MTFFIPLEPRRLLLCYSPLQFIFSGAHDCLRQLSPKTVNKKSVPAESASLKIGYSSLKIRNLPFYARCKNGFKQTDFLRFVPPIFLTLTSQGGNQGIAHAMDKNEIRLREIPFIKLQSLFLHPFVSLLQHFSKFQPTHFLFVNTINQLRVFR